MFRLEQLVEEQKSKVSKVMPDEMDSAAKHMMILSIYPLIKSLEFLESYPLKPLNFIPCILPPDELWAPHQANDHSTMIPQS